MKHIPRKRFGQHFLSDKGIIEDIVQAIAPHPGQPMVEIGPGLAALTQPLVERLGRLTVIELDRDLALRLRLHGQLEVIESDVLKVDFTALALAMREKAALPGLKLRVVGNLPYNISTPILFHLLDNLPQIADMHFMLQKEVVERMVAAPSTPAYGRLSVMLQYRLQMEYLFTVPPQAFEPPPKVESAFVRAVPHERLPHVAQDEPLFAKVVTSAFGQRRKTLRNTLKGLLDDAGFAVLGIDPQLRAENLGVGEFVAIANHLA